MSRSPAFATRREALPGEIRAQWWREVLQGLRDGEAAAHPVGKALREMLVRYGFVVDLLLEPIEARTFDLYDEPMASLGELACAHLDAVADLRHEVRHLGGGMAAPELSTLDAAIGSSTIDVIPSEFGRHVRGGSCSCRSMY